MALAALHALVRRVARYHSYEIARRELTIAIRVSVEHRKRLAVFPDAPLADVVHPVRTSGLVASDGGDNDEVDRSARLGCRFEPPGLDAEEHFVVGGLRAIRATLPFFRVRVPVDDDNGVRQSLSSRASWAEHAGQNQEWEEPVPYHAPMMRVVGYLAVPAW